MNIEKITTWRVQVKGDVIVEASSAEDATAKASEHFINTGLNLAWSADEVEVYIDHRDVVPFPP
jgi:hypothetical protein